jgi:glycosyltransferase involved in cell wall biosynthesis
MRVHFDSQIFAAQAFGGISRYYASLAQALDGLEGIHPKLLAPIHINGYLQAIPRKLVWGHPSAHQLLPKPAVRVASLLACAAMQASRSSDILHRTYYYPLCHLPGRAKNVLTVYDMIHERFPQHFSPRDPIAAWKKRAIKAADKIICISEHTRHDLLALNEQLDPARVAVTHLGFDALDQRLLDLPARAWREQVVGSDTPYILFVGSRGGHKNFLRLLQAYAASPWLHTHFALLCFGGGDFSSAENAAIAQAGQGLRVRQTGGDDSLLAASYRHASLFVYPSLYEGFGIPPLEAMSLGCPVACSHTSSVPEVVGDAAALFEPTSIEDMRHAMESVLNATATAKSLVERGHARAEQFSWQRCAEATAAIYRETLAT